MRQRQMGKVPKYQSQSFKPASLSGGVRSRGLFSSSSSSSSSTLAVSFAGPFSGPFGVPDSSSSDMGTMAAETGGGAERQEEIAQTGGPGPASGRTLRFFGVGQSLLSPSLSLLQRPDSMPKWGAGCCGVAGASPGSSRGGGRALSALSPCLQASFWSLTLPLPPVLSALELGLEPQDGFSSGPPLSFNSVMTLRSRGSWPCIQGRTSPMPDKLMLLREVLDFLVEGECASPASTVSASSMASFILSAPMVLRMLLCLKAPRRFSPAE
mmetsp:Transcript_81310/g.180893  ORF Transcript_81310/g.180893 Transcript_81310/m.180893 type:complete len:268 (-) Transcript_81310:990-1793(-)